MKSKKIAALSLIAVMAGTSLAFAQATTGTSSAMPERGSGSYGVGAPPEGRSSNQPGSASQPNSAATPGPSTQGTPGNMPSGTTR